MGYPCSCCNALEFTWFQYLSIPHRVFVFEFSGQDIRHNLHIPMRMGAETLPRSYAILVDNSKAPKAHVIHVMIPGKGKRVERFEPAMIR
jgi:hypothetical protein